MKQPIYENLYTVPAGSVKRTEVVKDSCPKTIFKNVLITLLVVFLYGYH